MKIFSRLFYPLIVTSILISSLSAVVLLSLDAEYAKRQLVFIILGLVFYVIFMSFDYKLFSYYSKFVYFLVLVVLGMTYLVGVTVKGASRWVDIGFFTFQPSELSKIVLILVLATRLQDFLVKKIPPWHILTNFALVSAAAFFVYIQPDLGTSVVFFLIFGVMFLLLKVKRIYLLMVFIIFGIFSSTFWGSLQDYQKDRIIHYLNPSSDPLGSSYNVLQSQIAVGSGEIFGRGFGHGTQSKLRFLPEFHTDFIYASFSEEWGLVGVMILLTLYAVLFGCILYVLFSTTDKVGFLVTVGVFAMLLGQIFINIGMNVGLTPVTGIPLPLMSYGGSSVVSTYIALALVNSVYLNIRSSGFEHGK